MPEKGKGLNLKVYLLDTEFEKSVKSWLGEASSQAGEGLWAEVIKC